MSKIDIEHLTDLQELKNMAHELFEDKKEQSVNVYGLNVPETIFSKAIYNADSKTYSWKDKEGKLHCPSDSLPAVIWEDGTLEYYKHGYLHHTTGSAVVNINHPSGQEYWIHGTRVTFDEHIHYVEKENKIIYTKNGKLHRKDGPAIIDFNPTTAGYKPEQEYWENGVALMDWTNNTITVSSDSDMTISTDTTISNEGGVWIIQNSEIEQEEENQIMTEETIIRGGPDLSGGRLNQVWKGGTHGFKKGMLTASSQLVADKIVETVPLEIDNEIAPKIVQIILLMLSAEAVNFIPEAVADKIHLDYDTQRETVSLIRETCGETIGRELVELATSMVPYIKDLFVDFSKEEIIEFAEQYETSDTTKTEAGEDFRQTLEDLMEKSEQVEEEEVEVEYVER